jgi:hypothetical protein
LLSVRAELADKVVLQALMAVVAVGALVDTQVVGARAGLAI